MTGGRQGCLHFQPTDRPTVSPWKILTDYKHSYNLMKLTWGALLYKVMNPPPLSAVFLIRSPSP